MSLEFTNLPLYRVGLRLILGDLPADGPDLTTVASRLTESGRVVEEDGNTEGTIVWNNPEKGLRGILREDTLMVFWYREEKEQYPRYSILSTEVESCCALLKSILQFSVKIAGIMYTQLEVFDSNDALSFEAYLSERHRMPIISKSEAYGYEIAWRSENGFDFRLSLERFRPDPADAEAVAVLLSSSCGAFCADESKYQETLDAVHEAIQPAFISMIAPDTLERWGYRNVEQN